MHRSEVNITALCGIGVIAFIWRLNQCKSENTRGQPIAPPLLLYLPGSEYHEEQSARCMEACSSDQWYTGDTCL